MVISIGHGMTKTDGIVRARLYFAIERLKSALDLFEGLFLDCSVSLLCAQAIYPILFFFQ